MAVADDRPVAPLTPMGRSLLAVLLVDAGRSVSEARLTEALWGANPPPTSKAALQNLVLKVRRTLGAPYSSCIRRTYDGYLIEVAAGRLDLQEFNELCRAGTDAARAGRWQEAVDVLSRALNLWRGEPLSDALPATRDAVGVDRFCEARLQAGEQLGRARLELGQYDMAVVELSQMARDHPWREAIHSHLMHALHGAGRQAEALDVYRVLRAGLVAELGVEPSTAVTEMHRRILTADPELLAPSRGTSPAPPSADAPPTAAGAATTRPGHRRSPRGSDHWLPARPPLLIGCDQELAELTRQAIAPDSTVQTGATVLSGTAGVGKTALALTWAHDAADWFPGGRIYLDLNGFAPVGRPVKTDAAVRVLLDFLGLSRDRLPATPEGRLALYQSIAADERFLVVLENARDARQVRPLIPTSGACRVVVTSRHTLAGLVMHDGAGSIDLTPLAAPDARDLLIRRLGPARAAEHEATIALMAERCARLPLALTIAAARAAALSQVPLDRIAEQLAAEHGGLAMLDGGDPTTSVRAVISWSYQQLTPGAAWLFRHVSLHPGPDFTLAAATALAGTGRDAAASDLVELRAISMIAESSPGRYSTHNLLRAFARERLRIEESGPDRSAAHRRMMDFYTASCFAANRLVSHYSDRWDVSAPTPDPLREHETFSTLEAATSWFVAEADVLQNVVAAADAAGSDLDVWRLGCAQAVHLTRESRWRTALELSSLALAAAERDGATVPRGFLHSQIGGLLARLGDIPAGRAHLLQGLSVFESAGDAAGVAHTYQYLANVLALEGDWAAAIAPMRRFLDFHQARENRIGEAMALNSIGWFLAHLDDPEAALEPCRQGLEIIESTGRNDLAAHVLDSLGYIHHRLGDLDNAAADYQAAAQLCADAGYSYQEASERLRLGDIHAARGDIESAREAWTRALVLFEATGLPEAEETRRRLAD